MAKKPRDPDKNDKKIVDGWAKSDRKTSRKFGDGKPDGGFDRYCPTCLDYYSPSDDAAHAGH